MKFCKCQGCGCNGEIEEPVVRGPTKTKNEVWICLWCDSTICVRCYYKHTMQKHPNDWDKKSEGDE